MRRTFYPLIALASILVTGATVRGQVPNDDCANAIVIACDDTLSGTTTGATVDDAANCGTAVEAPGIWYRFEGVLGQITATTCSNFGYDTKINVYSGSCDALVCVGGNDDFCDLGSSATFVAEVGTTYYILVNGFEGAVGEFDLAISCGPITEDDCQGALPLACGATVTGSTATALNDAVVDCETTVSAPGAWCSFTGIDGQLILTTCNGGTNYDTKLNIYTGACDSLVCVDGDDDTPGQGACSTVIFNSTAGVIYYALVQGFDGETGDFELSLTCQTCGTPQNIDITAVDVSAQLNWDSPNTGAQFSVEYGPTGFTPGTGTVITGTYGIDGPPVNMTGLTLATDYEVYITENCGGGDLSIPAGPVEFTTLSQPPAANAYCASPTPLICGSTVEGNTIFGLLTPGPTCGSANITTNGLWFSFTGTGEEVTLATCDAANFDSKISVFSGTCTELVCVAGNDDAPGCGTTSSTTLLSITGTNYLVLVHGYEEDQGLFTLSMTCAPGCPAAENDQCDAATVLSVQPLGGCESSIGSTICAYPPALPNPPCDPFAPIVDVWYRFNSGWGTSASLIITQLTVADLFVALYTDCAEPQYLECWDGVNGALDITDLIELNTDYLVRVWNGGGPDAGTFAICVESDFGTGVRPAAAGTAAMLLFPNPANNMLHVRSASDVATLAVIDLQGRVMLIAPTLGRNELALPVTSLAPGTYLLRAVDGDGRMLGRFVKE